MSPVSWSVDSINCELSIESTPWKGSQLLENPLYLEWNKPAGKPTLSPPHEPQRTA
jgi:hypothetical protein